MCDQKLIERAGELAFNLAVVGDDEGGGHVLGTQGCIPIFPDRFVAEAADKIGDFGRRTFVSNVELPGGVRVGAGSGPFASAKFDDATALSMMKFLFACAGVAPGFGMAAGAHQCNAKRDQAIAEASRFAGGEDEADIRKHDAKGADQLDELAVCDVCERLKFAGAGAKPGK